MLTPDELARVHNALHDVESAQRHLEAAHDKLKGLFEFAEELGDVARGFTATRTARRFIERRLLAMDKEIEKCNSTTTESGS